MTQPIADAAAVPRLRSGASGAARIERLVRLMAIALALGFTLARWSPVTGFTALPRFGERHADRRVPAIRTLPIAPSPGDGYDGQWYAQIAVDLHVTSPEVVAALDKPAYRPRRILVPILAHLLGAGDPWTVLQAFVLLHVAAWLALAAILWRILPPGNWRATGAWFGAVMGTGVLDSMRMTLTDLPAVVLLLLGLIAVERGRPRLAALALLGAGFVRELSLGALMVLRHGPEANPTLDPRTAARRAVWLRIAVAAPVLAWCGWLAWRIPGVVGYEGNIALPGLAFARQMADNVRLIASGNRDSQWWFGLLGGLALAAQSAFVLRRWQLFRSNAWVALAVPFAVLFWLIGADPWIDYRAVARDCLPMTIGFNVLWMRDRDAGPLWMLANLSVVDGISRLTWP